MGRLAATSLGKSLSIGITALLSSIISSANAPISGRPIILVPTLVLTLFPTSLTIPAISFPGINGGSITI